MGNVTDSLDFVLEHLGELQHELDALGDQIDHDADSGPVALRRTSAAWAKAAGHLAWLQARVEGERALLARLGGMIRSQKCGNCGRWFEVDSGTAERRRWCSAACRQAAYRARLDQGDDAPTDKAR